MGQLLGLGARKRKLEDGRDDVKRQIDSDPSDTRPIYQLVNVKTGGGRLIELIKARARRHSSSLVSFKQQTSTTSTASAAGLNLEAGGGSKRHDESLDERLVDEQIRRLVEPLLYNAGRGKWVPLARLWSWRLGIGDASGSSALDSDVELDDCLSGEAGASKQAASRAGHRKVCWRLNERGFVGETALHICFLLSTPSHMILAQKLLKLFPALINDIYLCDEYFGESSLHMAIVNEDVKIVKLLLDHGASVHERCLGSFFLPHDQKARANQLVRRKLELLAASNHHHHKPPPSSGHFKQQLDSQQLELQSNEFSSLETNYEGYTYWGEYPLSFAASLGLADCYKLLLAKGANPNRRDSNGNSTLHICVIANRLDMFDLCHAHGAQLDSTNKLGLTPLSLAARLKRVQMLFHILTLRRQVSWLLCNVAFVDYPLKGIDSIDAQTGAFDDCSLLAIVVSGNSNEHLQMLDGLLGELLQIKWDTSLRRRFYAWLAMFLGLLLIASVAYITRFHRHEHERGPVHFASAAASRPQLQQVRLMNQLSELALIACVLYYLSLLVGRCGLARATIKRRRVADGVDDELQLELEPQRSNSGGGGLARVLAQAPELSIFTLTCLLILACIPLRLLKLTHLEDSLAAIIMFLLPLKLLFFCRGSKSLGSFIVMIYRILVNDVLCFVVFLVIFISGFAQSFLIIFKTYRPRADGPPNDASASAAATMGNLKLANATTDANGRVHLASLFESIVSGDSHFLNLFDALITMHMMALNEFSWVLDEFQATDYPKLAKLMFCVYMILVSILLINMLIAMLGKTYQDITSQPNENLRQWARALLTVEQVCSSAARLQMLGQYSHLVAASSASDERRKQPAAPPRRCYSSTWALQPSDLEEINAIKQLKREHTINEKRLAARASRRQSTSAQQVAGDLENGF